MNTPGRYRNRDLLPFSGKELKWDKWILIRPVVLYYTEYEVLQSNAAL